MLKKGVSKCVRKRSKGSEEWDGAEQGLTDEGMGRGGGAGNRLER